MNTAQVLTAVAAVLAALLSGVTLFVSGRREQARWTRDSLIDALVSFLDASFALNAASGIASLPNTTDTHRKTLRQEVIEAHDVETATLTRLRMLASRVVVQAAEALHAAEHDFAHHCFSPAGEHASDIETARQAMRDSRMTFIKEARAALNLRDTAPINHRHSHLNWEHFVGEANGP